MKKLVYRIALIAALFGAGSVVLHASHLDASHLDASHAQSSNSHDCGLCRVVTSADFPVVQSHDPIFTLAYDLILVVITEITGRTVCPSHPRAPPIN